MLSEKGRYQGAFVRYGARVAARAPYFSNGSARTLRQVVDYYDRHYNIGYTEQEKQDLVSLMSAL